MSKTKTAISIEQSLLEEAIRIAHELNISRNRLFIIALEEYLRRYHNKSLIDSPKHRPREGWDAKFAAATKHGDDPFLDETAPSRLEE